MTSQLFTDESTSNDGISNLGTIGGLVLRVTVIFNPSVVWIVAPVVILTYSKVDYIRKFRVGKKSHPQVHLGVKGTETTYMSVISLIIYQKEMPKIKRGQHNSQEELQVPFENQIVEQALQLPLYSEDRCKS